MTEVEGGGCVRLGCWERLRKGLLKMKCKEQEEANGKMIPGPAKSWLKAPRYR